MSINIVLGSASPARAQILERAGVAFEQVAADLDEQALVTDLPEPRAQAQALAAAKGHVVADILLAQDRVTDPTYVIAADSVFEFEGQAFGKPHTPEVATRRWQAQRGNTGILHSGHTVIAVLGGRKQRVLQETVSATVSFADVPDAVIEAYVATGEPLGVAGGFTLEGHGATMITGIDGDPNAVLGLSLRAVREMLQRLDVSLTSLWHATT
ncbi:MAG: septum formation protein Maf [Micrococcaceae bacterium]|nr:septum formation protein Maf [Micrococcaceae bacterium]